MKDLRPILLVEDSLQDAELTISALTDRHLTNDIVHARDGVEALDFLHRRGAFAGRADEEPAFILLDLKMPRMDGLEVLRHVKGDSSLKAIPIVMLTSSKEESDLVESYRLGVNAYVVKPVDFEQFSDAVKNAGAFWAIVNEPPPRS